MSRTIRTFLPISGEPATAIAAFLDDPARWLPGARHTGPDRWELVVGAGGVERPVEVTIGSPWNLGGTWWRSLSWSPLPDVRDPVAVERLLPVLDAELGVASAGGRLTLVLDGRYQPPGGRMGDAIDAVALRRIAQRTLDRLLAEIAVLLAEPVAVDQPAR